MQAASLPYSVPCNPGKDFLNFTYLSINTEKPQEWRTSPFRRTLDKKGAPPTWNIITSEVLSYTQEDNRTHWIELKHLFTHFRFPEILNQGIVFFHFSNLIFCLANDLTVKKAVLNKDCTQTLTREKRKPVIAALFYTDDKIENISQGFLQISTDDDLMQGTAIAPSLFTRYWLWLRK